MIVHENNGSMNGTEIIIRSLQVNSATGNTCKQEFPMPFITAW